MGLNAPNKVWQKDELAALITLYETERCLYDAKDKHYNDPVKQKEAYERIHKVMHRIRSCTVGEIKYKIKYLTRQYSGEILERNINIQAGLCTEKSYKSNMWCFGLLRFLDNCMSLKNTSTTAVCMQEDKVSPEKVVPDPPASSPSPSPSPSHQEPSGSSDAASENGGVSENSEEGNTRKKRKLSRSSSSCAASPPKIVAKTVPVEDSFVTIDREDIFGQYVASELKSIRDNPLLYLQTKQTILSILTSANFEILNPE